MHAHRRRGIKHASKCRGTSWHACAPAQRHQACIEMQRHELACMRTSAEAESPTLTTDCPDCERPCQARRLPVVERGNALPRPQWLDAHLPGDWRSRRVTPDGGNGLAIEGLPVAGGGCIAPQPASDGRPLPMAVTATGGDGQVVVDGDSRYYLLHWEFSQR